MNWRLLALIISVLGHPLLLPTLVCGAIFYVVPLNMMTVPERAKFTLLGLFFLMTFVAPVVGILLYYWSGSVSSLTMRSRQDRLYPFVFTTGLYGIITYLLATAQGDVFLFTRILAWFLGGVTATLAIVTAVTFYWKISAHGAGISGVLGFWLGLACRYPDEQVLYPFLWTLGFMGILLTARLYLQAHTPQQIWAGFAVGFCINFVTVLVAVV